MYLSIPEYGFSSKLLSAKKAKRFVPTTPAKKNKSHASHEIYSPFANFIHFSDELQLSDLQNIKCAPSRKVVVTTQQINKSNRFLTDFEVIAKLGEGSFGEAFKVKSRENGLYYAVKKAKQKYLGYRDREQKLSEVHKALKITQNLPES